MYEAFDPFLRRETWSSNHALDEAAFLQAVHKVVHYPDFSPEKVGDYIRQKVGAARAEADQEAISLLVTKAWAVRDYLDANNLFRPLDEHGKPIID